MVLTASRTAAALAAILAAVVAVSCGPARVESRPPIVQPGAPGQPARTLDAAAATDLRGVRFTADDVKFMQGMIGHHQQAIEMTALMTTNSADPAMKLLGQRISLSQSDEVSMMRRWLEVRGQAVPDEHAMHQHGATLMPGMLTQDEMARLADAKGPQFDRLFLEGMIKHHGGALTMVEALFAAAGAAQESDIFAFASDVDADQRMEIARMGAMLEERMK
jgi:uncharacterized protein (DUF305 family)